MWFPRINAKYFNLAGNGITDDRAALQLAIDAAAGCDLIIPAGIYAVGPAPGQYWCLKVPRGTRIRGEEAGSVVLKQLPSGPSVRLLHIADGDCVIADLELDGNKSAQTPDEHRAGIFVAWPRVTIENVVCSNFTGDGVYLYSGANNVDIRRLICRSNDRNGLTFGGGTSNTRIEDSQFLSNKVQQVDSEPKGTAVVDDVWMDRCQMLSNTESNDYALTITGSGAASRSSGWVVRDCELDGGIQVCWSDGVRLNGLSIRNTTTKPCLRVYRATSRVVLEDSNLEQLTAASAIVDVQGTAGQAPDSITIYANTMRAHGPTTHGVTVELARSCTVERNTIVGTGIPTPYVSGVYARTTLVTQPMAILDVHANSIVNFGQYGVMCNNVPGCVIEAIEVTDNRFLSDASPSSMTAATAFDAGCPDVLMTRNRNTGCLGVAPLKQPPGVLVLADGERNEWHWVVPVTSP